MCKHTTLSELADMVHIHPTLSEILKNAANYLTGNSSDSQMRLSASCASCVSSATFIRERMVTIGSMISQSFRASIIVRITLPAEGAQLPFSTIPNLRF